MEADRLVLTSLCLLLCWMLPAGSIKISDFVNVLAGQSFPLDMSKDSVDDMYSTCTENMEEMVQKLYFKKETKDRTFQDVWEHAEGCATNAFPHRKKEDGALTKNHIQALCVYTTNYKKFYKNFNEAVRTKRREYGSLFPYHSLHFWLTRAVQILSNHQTCHRTYRRTTDKFTGNVKTVIRFGNFASSSKLTNLTLFGSETCFQIKSCSGAYVKNYSKSVGEEEVLIPPYEMFEITKKCTSKNCKPEGLTDCKTVYVLQSAGVHSNVDCKLGKFTLV